MIKLGLVLKKLLYLQGREIQIIFCEPVKYKFVLMLKILSEDSRDVGVKFHYLASYGVDERDDLSMEAEAAERIGLGAIAFVASDRVADRGKLHADLVFTTSFESDFHKGVTAVVFDYAIVGDSLFASIVDRRSLHFERFRILSEPRDDLTLRLFHFAFDNANVLAADDVFVPTLL